MLVALLPVLVIQAVWDMVHDSESVQVDRESRALGDYVS